jgi:stage II sporulation protein M
MLRRNYSDEWLFFRRTLFRTFLALSVLGLIIIAMSYDHYKRHPEKIRAKTGVLEKYVQEHDLAGKVGIKRCTKLFLNNLVASFQATTSGFMPFLFLPTVTVIVSSIPAGLLIAANEAAGIQNNFSFILKRLFPHGIFEFVAMIYASSIGIFLTEQISKKLIPKYKSNVPPLRNLCVQAGRSFLQVVVPLLLIAALVQTFITAK